ncbi:MAG: undecaprenyl-diphosphate phosphatase [Solirubrobacteraceae bacterium]
MPDPVPLPPPRALAAAQIAGLIHGPAEALPVSSSAHVALVTRLVAGRRGQRPADAELAKAVEVAAHAGTLIGLAIGLREEAVTVARGAPAHPRQALRAAGLLTVASVPAAVAALAFERRIEDRLGSDRTIAAGLLMGGVAMAMADRDRPSATAGGGRAWTDATVVDALLVGTAQSLALWPGVSRSGAVLAATRARGFARADAGRISAAMAVPVVGGATALKSVRLARRVADRTILPGRLAPIGALTVASAVSGRAAAPLARRTLHGVRLAPFAVYRAAVATALLVSGR